MRRLILILVLFALGSLATPVLAAGYSVTVQTDRTSYVGMAQIAISGTVSPAPGPNTAVIVVVSNPNRATVDIQDDPVDPATGTFSQLTVSGGGQLWIAGTYLVNATWGGSGGTAIGTTKFEYSPGTATTTTSVSCAPTSFVTGATSQCTATVSGATGTISGEPIYWGATGSVVQGQGCTLSGTSCSITFTGGSPGPATIRASYTGDAMDGPSLGNTNVTVLAATTTSVSCTLSEFLITSTTTCTATVTGAVGAIGGETVTFSQAPGQGGSVTIAPPGTCSLGPGGNCSISVTAATAGAVTLEAAYPGDPFNGASSGNATLAALVGHTDVTTSNSSSTSSPSTSSSTTTLSTTTCVDCSVTFTPTTSSGGGTGSVVYFILIAVAVIVVLFGVVMWRRKVAGDYGNQPATK